MGILKLRKWPADRIKPYTLNWILSPVRDDTKDWTIDALFQEGNTQRLITIQLPFNALPNLRFGRTYIDGALTETQPSTQTILSKFFRYGQWIPASRLSSSLYPLFNNPDSRIEWVWRFREGSEIYYVPCLELVRTLFVPNRSLAHSLLIPNGIDALVNDQSIENRALKLTLTSKFPIGLLQPKERADAHITHFGWIMCNPLARKAWESVYQYLFTAAIRTNPALPLHQLANRIPLQMSLPFTADLKLIYVGRSHQNHHLITEIVGLKDHADLPFDSVEYSHPSLKKTPKVIVTDVQHIPTNLGDDVELDDSGLPAKDETPKTMIEPPAFQFGLKSQLKIKRILVEADQPKDTRDILVNEHRKPSKTLIRSANRSVYGGKEKPLEFASLEQMVADFNAPGLERFLSALTIVQRTYPDDLNIHFSIENLTKYDALDKTADGSPRKYAWVSVAGNGDERCYILELAYPSTATLFIQSPNAKRPEVILNFLNKHDGHFVPERLPDDLKTIIFSLKHSSTRKESNDAQRKYWRDIYLWANRIVVQLKVLGFELAE